MSARTPDRRLRAAVVAFALCPLVSTAKTTADDAFQPLEPAVLTGPGYYTSERFPGLGDSVFHPDGGLAAPVRAVLLVDAQAGDPPRHARYRVRYDLVPGAGEQDPPIAHVEVIRLDLGRAVREDLQAQDPALPLAPPEAFGTGPHLAYRFLMQPVQGMEAHVIEAWVREVGDDEAGSLDCLEGPCLALAAEHGPDGAWQPLDARLPALPFASAEALMPSAPAQLAFLLDALGEDARRPVPRGESPRFEFSLGRNVDGQVDMASSVARNAVVFDDAIGTHWVRWRVIEGAAAEAASLSVAR